jgi:hypothetical protein
MDFFPLFENVSGLRRGMEVCYDWPGVMEQPLMLHFVPRTGMSRNFILPS